MSRSIFLKLLAVCSILALSSAQQCPNQLAATNPNIRSTCLNQTTFIVPIDKATVAKAVFPYKLLPVPTTDKSLFPNGFPTDKHPVLVTSGIQSDIRMSALQLQDPLLGGSELVPYVDRLNDGKTPFVFSAKQYIGGYNGKDVSAVVPTLVGSLGGTPINYATFVPNNAAYQLISSTPPEFQSQVKQVIVPNPISGPDIINEAFDLDFFTATTSTYTAHTFHALISQPQILFNGLCQRNPIYFNFMFSDPAFRSGKVTLASPGGAFAGVFDNVPGYSAAGNMLGYNAESCSSAAANTDPNALA